MILYLLFILASMTLRLCLVLFYYAVLSVISSFEWISKGSFMRTKHPCVLIYIRITGELCTVEVV